MTYSYQWYRATDAAGTGATAISERHLASYTLTTSDAHKFLKVIVTANDANGSSTQTAESTHTTIANTAPVNSAVPSTGTTTVGNALTATHRHLERHRQRHGDLQLPMVPRDRRRRHRRHRDLGRHGRPATR